MAARNAKAVAKKLLGQATRRVQGFRVQGFRVQGFRALVFQGLEFKISGV